MNGVHSLDITFDRSHGGDTNVMDATDVDRLTCGDMPDFGQLCRVS